MRSFKPTHRIFVPDPKNPIGEISFLVQLETDDPDFGGPAYTEVEWESGLLASYERQDDGTWTFQGQPFNGRVEKLSGGES